MSRPSTAPQRPSAKKREPQRRKGHGLARFALGIAAGLGLGVTFTAALVGGVVLHLNAPSMRRTIGHVGSEVLSSTFVGTFTLEDVRHVGPHDLELGALVVKDMQGRPVLVAKDARIDYSVFAVAKALLGKHAAARVDSVTLSSLDLALLDDGKGSPSLGQAFAAKKPSAPSAPNEAGLNLTLAQIDVPKITVHGAVGTTPIHVDGTLHGARVLVEPIGVRVIIADVAADVAPIPGTLPATAKVRAAGEIRMPNVAPPDQPDVELRAMNVTVESAGATVTAQASLVAGKLDAHVTASATPDAVAAFTGGAPPVWAPLDVELDAHGTMKAVDVDAKVTLSRGSLEAQGHVDLEALAAKPSKDVPRIALADAKIALNGIQARAFAPTAPAIVASGEISLRATATEQGTEVNFTGDRAVFDPDWIDPFDPKRPPKGSTIFSTDGVALLRKDGSIAASGDAHVSVEEVKTDVAFQYDSASGKAGARVHVSVPALADLEVVKLPVGGKATVDVGAEADLKAKTFTLGGQIVADDLQAGALRVPRAVVTVHGEGPFDDPKLSADVRAGEVRNVDVMTGHVDTIVQDVDVALGGTKEDLKVKGSFATPKGQHVELTTHIAQTPTGVKVFDLDAKLRRELFRMELKVKELAVANGAFSLKGLRLASTSGGLRLDGAFDPKKHALDLSLATTTIDVNTLLFGLGMDPGMTQVRGKVSAELHTVQAKDRPKAPPSALDDDGVLRAFVDAPTGAPKPRAPTNDPYVVGHVHVEGNGKIDLPPIIGPALSHLLDASVDLDLDDRLVDAKVDVKLKDFVEATVHAGGAIAGRLDDPNAWMNAIGHVDFDVPEVDLTPMVKVLGLTHATPITDGGGTIALHAHVERKAADAPPTALVSFDGKKLRVTTDSFSLPSSDLHVHARLMKDPDHDLVDGMTISLSTRLSDQFGKLVALDVATREGWSKLVALAQGKAGDTMAAIEQLPAYVRFEIPERPLAKLPSVVKSALPFDGTLGAKLAVDGTIGKPLVALDAAISKIKLDRKSAPYAVQLHATYDGEEAKAHVGVGVDSNQRGPDGRPIPQALGVDAIVALASKDFFAPRAPDAALPWTAKIDAKLEKLPLKLFAAFTGGEVKGFVNGAVHVDHVNDPKAASPTVDAKIDFQALAVGDTTYSNAQILAHVDGKAANARVDLGGGNGGEAHVKVDAPLAWKNATAPSLANGAPIKATVQTKALRLQALEPFITAFDQLDGKLDANLVASIAPKEIADPKAPGGKSTKITGGVRGTVKLSDGVMIVGAIGERWQGVTADIALGDKSVDIRNVTIHGVHGTGTIAGSIALADLMPTSMHVKIDAKRLPFASQGVAIGDLSGTVTVDGTMKPDLMDMKVVIDPMTVDLADSTGKHPQALEPDPSIVVLQPVEAPKPPPAAASSQVIKVAVSMPHFVWVRRSDLRVAVEGNPTITVRDVASFGGEVRVEKGYIEEFGKRFLVDHARVKFDGSADFDPALDVAVKWEAPDGTDVTISVSGQLSTPKITMTADPTATQAEIMSLLVLGRRDAGSASQQEKAQQGSAAEAAGIVQGLAGSIFGQQLQKMLPTSMSLSFQPGSEGFADARYAGGYQWKNVYFEVGYNAGAGENSSPAPAQQSESRATFGVDWRFKPTWSLMTTLGDAGSALVDLLWNYRY